MNTRQRNVLLIEDNLADAQLTSEILRSDRLHTWVVTRAPRLESGLRLLARTNFDVAVVDLDLPDSQGIDTVRVLQQQAPYTPLVVVTRADEHGLTIEALKSGAVEYIRKDDQNGSQRLLQRALSHAIERHEIVSEWHRTLQTLRDTSDRKQNRLKLINEVARLINSRLDMKSMLDSAADAVVASLGLEGAGIFVPEGPLMRLYSSKTANGSVCHSHEPFDLSNTRFEQCFGYRNPVYSERIERGVEGICKSNRGTASEVLVPIMDADEPLAALSVVRTDNDAFTDEDVEFLAQVSVHLSIGMKNASLYTELQQAYDTLSNNQEQMFQQERLSALGAMASGICHDFNNTLTPILGFSEMLLKFKEELSTDERDSYLRTISRRARDASRVVQRLRDFYRKRSNKEGFTAVDLNALVKEVVEIAQPRWKDQANLDGRQISIETDLVDVPLVNANEPELRGAIVNLVFNAIDAIEDKGNIVCRTRNYGQSVGIQIEDNGSGMNLKVRESCLDPFFTTKGKSGTGLGLAMVSGIVKHHDGRLDVRSEEGVGTTISIVLPALGMEMTEEQADEDVAPVAIQRVLIVDDEPEILDVLSDYLKLDRHEVITAHSGSEAVEAFSLHQIDLIITDRGMPEMNGDQVASVIKTLSPGTPVIMLSGVVDLANSDRSSCIDCVISKPLSLNSLRRAMAEVAVPRD